MNNHVPKPPPITKIILEIERDVELEVVTSLEKPLLAMIVYFKIKVA
jgi:hypothetical protein